MEAERRADQAAMQMKGGRERRGHARGKWKIVPVETTRQERISLTRPFNFSFSPDRERNR